jgi:Tfp pilus assembly protein PilN
MRVIDFLPSDYLARRCARRTNLMCAAIGAGAVLLMGAAVGILVIQAIGVAHMRNVVDRKYAEASRQIQQMKDLENRKAGLLRKVELSASLLERVPRSYILARMTNELPAHTSLTTLTMSVVEVEQEAPPEAAAETKPDQADGKTPAANARAKGKTPAKKGPAKIKVKRTQFVLGGLATTDVEVADYISRLSADPIFEGVDLKFSEEFPYDENTRLRRFEIVLRLNPKAPDLLEGATDKVLTAAPAAPAKPARGES